jgi:tetratricopeptide (TPR) repeat protein
MKLDSSTKFVGYNNLGFFLKLEKKEYAAAKEYFDKSIELNPDFAYAYSNRGYSKLMLNDIKGAYKDLKKSISLDNTNSYAYKNLGLICLKDGKTKNACENFKKALELGYADRYDDEVDKMLKENCK